MSGGWAFDREDWDAVSALPDELALFAIRGEYKEVLFDPRKVLKCENQGSQGSCRGHSGSTNAEWILILQTGVTGVELSRAMMYYETQRIDNIRGDSGSTIMGGVKLLRDVGLCIEPMWQYPTRYDPSRPQNYPDVLENAAIHKIPNSRRLQTYDALRIHLGSGQGGVDLGIQWSSAYAAPVVENYSGGSGGHAIAVIALSERKDSSGRPYVWMFNSHGLRSGVQGWSEWSPSFVERAMGSSSNVFVGLSDMPNVKPRKFNVEDWKKELRV